MGSLGDRVISFSLRYNEPPFQCKKETKKKRWKKRKERAEVKRKKENKRAGKKERKERKLV